MVYPSKEEQKNQFFTQLYSVIFMECYATHFCWWGRYSFAANFAPSMQLLPFTLLLLIDLDLLLACYPELAKAAIISFVEFVKSKHFLKNCGPYCIRGPNLTCGRQSPFFPNFQQKWLKCPTPTASRGFHSNFLKLLADFWHFERRFSNGFKS